MASIVWNRDVAEIYDATSVDVFAPEVLDPMVARLAELAGDGPALELAIGTGRVALPLSARGVSVHGIELSPHMADRMRMKAGSESVPVTIGDMTTTRVPGEFGLVYLVFNTIMNVTTQDEQVAVFANAAAHLLPGGCFVVEVVVPQIRLLPPGQLGRVFEMAEEHVGIETFDDLVGQVTESHHWYAVDGRLARHSAPYRYVWPSELDLMARLAGLRLRERWAGWVREPFTSESTSQVAVFEKPGRSTAASSPFAVPDGHIRSAAPGDAAAIRDIAVTTGLFAADELGDIDAALAGFFDGERPDDAWLVFADGNEVGGAAYLAPEPFGDWVWNLLFLGVRPEHQAGGIGRALVAHVEQTLRDRGADVARVLVVETSGRDHFAATRAFYSGRGYVREATIRDYFGPDDDKVVFWKSLVGVRR